MNITELVLDLILYRSYNYTIYVEVKLFTDEQTLKPLYWCFTFYCINSQLLLSLLLESKSRDKLYVPLFE